MSGWIACCGGNGQGGGGSAEITFDLSLYRNGYQYQEDINLATGVGGNGDTDVAITIISFTAVGDVTVNIVPFQLMTNTGGNEGYCELIVDGISKYKKKLNSNTWTPLTDIVPVDLADGETLECNIGFDGTHSGCNFYYRQYQNS